MECRWEDLDYQYSINDFSFPQKDFKLKKCDELLRENYEARKAVVTKKRDWFKRQCTDLYNSLVEELITKINLSFQNCTDAKVDDYVSYLKHFSSLTDLDIIHAIKPKIEEFFKSHNYYCEIKIEEPICRGYKQSLDPFNLSIKVYVNKTLGAYEIDIKTKQIEEQKQNRKEG